MMDAAAAAAAVAAELQSPVYESVPNPTNYEREPGEQDVFECVTMVFLRSYKAYRDGKCESK